DAAHGVFVRASLAGELVEIGVRTHVVPNPIQQGIWNEVLVFDSAAVHQRLLGTRDDATTAPLMRLQYSSAVTGLHWIRHLASMPGIKSSGVSSSTAVASNTSWPCSCCICRFNAVMRPV